MGLFRRRSAVPCCPDTARILLTLDLIDAAMREQAHLYDEDRNLELVDLLFDLRAALAPHSLPARRPL